ncbi:uncharacterized protein LOC130747736 [Lotus japonicus]|uniref:uncharacterized protein LOC130747736 n=1 Tax=Lotus japonicus TaxID=34305 RepID=UPI002588F11F|nr:uncharacterized protein LOC130747736 [Lotus japonicus]
MWMKQAIRSTKRNPSHFEKVAKHYNSLHDSNSTVPSVNVPTNSKPRRGRPKKNKGTPLMEKMPIKFQPHISKIIDVLPDGNCGFRAVAALLGMGEHLWHDIRKKMIDEMKIRAEKYGAMYGAKLCQTIIDALHVAPEELVTEEKWFTIPDMGYIVATTFKVVLITLSNSGSTTFLPLAGAAPISHHIIVLGHVNRNHWVQAKLKGKHPIPRTAPQWRYHRDSDAEGWETSYKRRMTQYQKELEEQNLTKEQIVVDLTKD